MILIQAFENRIRWKHCEIFLLQVKLKMKKKRVSQSKQL